MKIVIEKYPNDLLRGVRLSKGDSIVVLHTDKNWAVGEQYDGFENLIVTKILHEPKKWWQFWKRKRTIGYEVTYIKD